MSEQEQDRHPILDREKWESISDYLAIQVRPAIVACLCIGPEPGSTQERVRQVLDERLVLLEGAVTCTVEAFLTGANFGIDLKSPEVPDEVMEACNEFCGLVHAKASAFAQELMRENNAQVHSAGNQLLSEIAEYLRKGRP